MKKNFYYNYSELPGAIVKFYSDSTIPHGDH